MKKVLIANRGEIAVRIIESARQMGMVTVAVYSVADREAPHVQLADEAVEIGGPDSASSYLDMDKIIGVAATVGADAIHPGYGFLSENAVFAKKVTEAGIIFVGPSPEAIRVMGSKLEAKATVSAYDIPMVPGTDKAITDASKAMEIARDIGFPILIKASAGGGGKGMRVVEKEEDLESQMERAISEAKAAFGDGSVFIEKYVTSPRHIEVQILADTHGNTVHLFERECSIQRRHQKVIEEAPSSVLTPELRERMGQAAIHVARSCDYVGAGTVEFLLDADHNFYFLEMNTRLQVEHPVTEMVTGLDLVRLQLEIAMGKALPFAQEDLKLHGHAIELRVYAEDPLDNFFPSTGTLETYRLPEGEGVRVDNGFYEGMKVPIYYDPMLSKLVCYGADRTEAIHRMRKAIGEYLVEGVRTTLPFGRFVMDHEAFISGQFDTHFVSQYYQPGSLEKARKEKSELAAVLALHHYLKTREKLSLPNSQP
ncbi:acetyl-CoA carboxylase biotin carboxylase subunit [Robertkochia sediminum]|uniref:acetyl-CoA carboxylase biotin carboxylase subunit n=1 Tax=Robertkochia sediminum TaxID=2785326 RepID=UPI001933109C|nr:acetyl-CoA carboxylase biotin carboxylase subunit [Robertkochia sediminum]MBL7472263.1 acetyl-CoA carboxylase biotin carboxylase subunit [Robertkochia sediminum]